MILQLDPYIPVYCTRFDMEGYAFLVINESQEHNILFVIALDNGEIWTLPNTEVRFCRNISMQRETTNKQKDTQFRELIKSYGNS